MSTKALHFLKILSIPVLLLLGFLLYAVFTGAWILPQQIHIGPLYIHYYGLTMALAVGLGFWLAQRRAEFFGISKTRVDNALLFIAFAGFIFARLYHVASSWQYYAGHFSEIFYIWHGGLSIFGALSGGFLALVVLSISKRNPFGARLLSLCDWLIPSVVLGQIIGRFGNFFNYEAFGYATNLPWKMFVPEVFRPDSLMQKSFFHPLFLYEAIGNSFILYVLFRYEKSKQNKRAEAGKIPTSYNPGTLFFMYLFLYNTLRFFLEFLRVDSTFIAGNLRLNTITSLGLLITGLIGLFYIQYRQNRTLVSHSS